MTYTAGLDSGAADADRVSRSPIWPLAAIGAAGRTAPRRTATSATVVVRQRSNGFGFMILTFLCKPPDLPATMLCARSCVRLK
jgi:hypothetical protein